MTKRKLGDILVPGTKLVSFQGKTYRADTLNDKGVNFEDRNETEDSPEKRRENTDKAMSCYVPASDAGYPPPMNNRALILEEQGDIEGAKEWYGRAIKLRYQLAVDNLGFLFETRPTDPSLGGFIDNCRLLDEINGVGVNEGVKSVFEIAHSRAISARALSKYYIFPREYMEKQTRTSVGNALVGLEYIPQKDGLDGLDCQGELYKLCRFAEATFPGILRAASEKKAGLEASESRKSPRIAALEAERAEKRLRIR